MHSNENHNDGHRKKNINSCNSKKRTRKEKELLQNKTNQENLAAAMMMLENINRNYYAELNRNTKNRMNEFTCFIER